MTKFTDVKTLTGHTDGVQSVAWSPDGNMLASGSTDNTIKIWNTTTWELTMTLIGHSGTVESVAWSPDGSTLASGARDNRIKIWDIDNGETIRTIDAHTDVVWEVAWNPNGSILASASTHNYTQLWDPQTGVNIMNLKGGDQKIMAIAWSPDGYKISTSEDTLRIWDVATGTNISTPSLYSAFWAITWSPDGSKLAASCSCGICVYNTTTWSNPREFGNYSYDANSLSWSPNGTMIASGEYLESDVKIWDIASGVVIETLLGHTKRVNSVAWSPDGKKIASGSDDDTIIIWGEPASNVYINSVITDKANIAIGDSTNVTIILANDGKADGLNIKLKLFDGSTLLTTRYVNVTHGETNSIEHLWKTTNSTPIGVHTLRAAIGMNEKSAMVTVIGRPNTYVKEVTVDKTNITIGEYATITAIIANNGTANATNIKVRFYDETGLIETRNVSVPQGGTTIAIFEWDTINMTPGRQTLKVVVEPSFKETTVNVKAPIVTLVKNGWIMWIVILLLFIMALALLARGMKGEKVTKESTKDKTIDEEWKKIDDSEE